MFSRKFLAATLSLISVSGTALAAATQIEADRIKTSLQSYLGSEPGVVAVAAEGDNYVITLDATPYLAKVGTSGFTAKIDPFVITARPKGDGQWDVSQSGPMAFAWNAPGVSAVEGKIASQEWNGVFDEATASFLSSTFAYTGITINQTMQDAQTKMKTTAATAYESWSGTSSAVPLGNGAVDVTSTMVISGVTSASKSEIPPEMVAAGMPNINYTLTNSKTDYTASAKGFRSKSILDLVAWLVAHPSKELVARDQGQLKEKILAALPLWESIDGAAKMNDTSVSSAFGQFGIPEGTFGLSMSGISKGGKFREAFGFSGLTIPPGIAPPWTEGLIPSSVKIDFTLDGVDLEAPAKLVLAQADFAKDPPLPPESRLLLLPAFAPKNTIAVTLQDGEISSPVYTLTYDANLLINLSGFPTGKANIRMTGLESVLAKVQAAAATDPSARQAMGGLVASKGFGKAEADGSTLWAIEVTPDSKVLVNGLDVSAMMGMAPPPPPPQP